MATFRERRGGVQAIIRRTGHPHLSKDFPTRLEAEIWAEEWEEKIRLGRDVETDAAKTPLRIIGEHLANVEGDVGYIEAQLETINRKLDRLLKGATNENDKNI